MYWRKKWQPALVFLPGKSHRERGLEGYSPWNCKSRTYVFLWLIHADVWQKSTQYCNYPPIKNKNLRRIYLVENMHTQKLAETSM